MTAGIKDQLMSNSKHQNIWLVGHLSTLLDLISLLDSTLELEFDERLIPVVDKYKHASSIISILYDRPLLTHGELAQALNLSKSTLSNALNRMKDCRLVFTDKHGREKYYTLSASGKKVHNHLNLLGTGITPDRLTVYIERIFDTLLQVLQKAKSPEEAMDRFSQITRQCTVNSPNLEQKMQKTIEVMESIQNNQATKLEDLKAENITLKKKNYNLERQNALWENYLYNEQRPGETSEKSYSFHDFFPLELKKECFERQGHGLKKFSESRRNLSADFPKKVKRSKGDFSSPIYSGYKWEQDYGRVSPII